MGSSPCTDCNFTFTTGPGGQRILSPAFEFLRLGRNTAQALGTSADLQRVLDWPTVDENVNLLEASCPGAIRRVSSTVTAIDVAGWFHLSLGLHGESATNCLDAADDEFMAGVLIELDRGGVTSIIAADIKDRAVCRSFSYDCSVERRLEAGDLLRTFYWFDAINVVMADASLPGSARNHFSVRTIRRA